MKLTDSIQEVPYRAGQLADAALRSMLWLLREDGGEHFEGRHIACQELKPALEFPTAAGRLEPSIQELANACGMSPGTFRRRMRECFGRSPKSVMLHRRMERAKALLVESPYTIESIATDLGYSEPAFFSRQFKRHVGISPIHYRTSNQ